MKVWVGWVLLVAFDACFRIRAEHRDLIFQAMCAAKCHKMGKECREKCYREPLIKAGFCGNNTNPFFNSCIVECGDDKDCASLDKCCSHQCGKTCQPPQHLLTVPGLPSIPENVTLLQISDMRNVMVNWDHPGDAQFVVELREESGPWTPAHKGPRATHPLRIPVRPGVHYAVRIAAVNEVGSKGFSQPSNTIILNLEERPLDPPEGIHFKGTVKNGSISGLLTWHPADSSQYISKYVVQWSQRFFVPEALSNKGSLEMHRKTVPHGKTCLRIKNLHPNSNYTFQVQAQMIYGKEKITSKKTTYYVDTSQFTSMAKRGTKQRPKDFHIYHKVIPTKDGLSVKISWPAHERAKYAISWETECDTRTISVVTTGSHYVIPSVKKDCQYMVFVREKSDCKKRRKLGKLRFKIT